MPFAVGDQVVAICPGWGDDLFPGVVREFLPNNEVQILWDGDSASISNVPFNLVRLRTPASAVPPARSLFRPPLSLVPIMMAPLPPPVELQPSPKVKSQVALLERVISVIGCSEKDARQLLVACKWDPEGAINKHFERDGTSSPPFGQSTLAGHDQQHGTSAKPSCAPPRRSRSRSRGRAAVDPNDAYGSLNNILLQAGNSIATILRSKDHSEQRAWKRVAELEEQLRLQTARSEQLAQDLSKSGTENGVRFQAELEMWKHGSAPFFLRPRPHLVGLVQEALQKAVPGDHVNSCSKMRNVIVREVREVQNMLQWEQYKMKRQHIVQRISGHVNCPPSATALPSASTISDVLSYIKLEPLANEVLLLHGTSEDKALEIAKNGFDGSLCRRAFYGKGVYFSPDACKVAEYVDDCNMLIIARVCLGHPFEATCARNRQDLPPKIEGLDCLHDSIIAKPGISKGYGKGSQVHWEVVIPARGDSQIYPELIVSFTTPTTSGNRSA